MVAIDTMSNLKDEAEYIVKMHRDASTMTKQHRDNVLKQLTQPGLNKEQVNELVDILTITGSDKWTDHR